MVRPFISYTQYRKERAVWLSEMLIALGFEDPILPDNPDKQTAKELEKDFERVHCLFALVSPPRKPSGQVADPSSPAQWISRAVDAAERHELPFTVLHEPGVDVSPMREAALLTESVDFDSSEAILKVTPKIIATAVQIQRVWGDGGQEPTDYVLDQFHVLNRFPNEREWHQVRTIKLTARKPVDYIEHGVSIDIDKAPGMCVKLADPAEDHLTVKCLKRQKDTDSLKRQITLNDERAVEYSVTFTPPVRRGETVEYRHQSDHRNMFPMTWQAVRERSNLVGSPPFMKQGFIGEGWDISMPTKELILEIEAALDLGLSSPEVRVYRIGTTKEYEEETTRIGNPETAPRFWKVHEDCRRELWTCRVTIPNPKGYTYCLLVRPTR